MLPARTTVLLLALAAPGILLAWAPVPFRQSSLDLRGWPGWRGPLRTGVSGGTKLLTHWGKAGPRLLWQATTLGVGFSSPAVSRGRIYVLGTRGDKEHLFVLDAAHAGKELWSAEIGPLFRPSSTQFMGPRSTPTLDGDRLYALGSAGDLVCLGLDGKERWRKHLLGDFQGQRGPWGYSESPLIDRDAVVCTPGGPGATMVALNKKTGAVLWKASVPTGSDAAYASAIVAEAGSVRQYIQFLSGCLVGIRASDGKLLWSYNGVLGAFNCATPVFHEGHVFITASGQPGKEGGALLALTPVKDAKGGVNAKEVYRNTTLASYLGGVVLFNGALYGTSDSALACIDFKTGKTNWQNPGVGPGGIIAADGHLYLRGDNGTMALATASPFRYDEKSRFDPPHRSKITTCAAPVIADGKLYLRDQEALLCYDLRKE
jgi:outer membrane protein assembly factor BamB